MSISASFLLSKHLVSLTGDSYWPLFVSTSVACILSSNVSWWRHQTMWPIMFSSLVLLVLSYAWSRDLGRESNFFGKHSLLSQVSLKIGMAFFIFSEVMFFFSFFWTYLHFALNPVADVGLVWPGQGVYGLDPVSVPLLNTLILVSSGATLTVSHHYLVWSKEEAIWWLSATLFMGVLFTVCQVFEYLTASFSISMSNYGSIFFVATGFHGLHVLVGSLLLFVSLVKMINFRFTKWHHVNFEMAAWYWHFVDVVWLFLYTIVYWWSS